MTGSFFALTVYYPRPSRDRKVHNSLYLLYEIDFRSRIHCRNATKTFKIVLNDAYAKFQLNFDDYTKREIFLQSLA